MPYLLKYTYIIYLLFIYLNINNLFANNQLDVINTNHKFELTEDEKQWINKNKYVKFTGDPSWLPVEGFDKNNIYIGMVADYLYKIENKTGLVFNKIKPKDWNEAVNMANRKDVDIISEVVAENMVNQTMNYTKPYIQTPLVVIMKNSENHMFIDKLNLIKDKKIAYVSGYGYVEDLIKKYPKIKFYEVPTVQDGLEQVASGQIDAFIETLIVSSYNISKLGLSNLDIVGRLDLIVNIGLGVRNDNQILLNILNKAFDSITIEEQDEIIHKWIKVEMKYKINWFLILQILAFILIIITVLVYFNYKLKKTVKEKTVDLELQKAKLKEFNLNLETLVMLRTIELEKTKTEIETVHKKTKDSIEHASLIQSSLIPNNYIFEQFFTDHFSIWQPKDIVGGDIYFVEQLNENEILIIVADCTGHGVPGAFVTMLVKAIERQIVYQALQNQEVSTANLLSLFNKNIKNILNQYEEIYESYKSNVGFDGAILHFNKNTKTLKFAGAKINLYYIESADSELKTIQADRHSIGYKHSRVNYIFTEHSIILKEGTQVFITTDGYLDQIGENKKMPFGKSRFIKIIKDNFNKNCKIQKDIFIEEFNIYKGSQSQTDDITLISFKI